jgi:leucine dehydrogenase
MSILQQMMAFGHERVCFHHDENTGLRAIVAIHSTVLGNALGGTRRWHYASETEALYDVLRLSEGMTYKAAAAGLDMGGAKSVVLLPGRGSPGSEAEARALGRFVDTFSGNYIAAEDVGTTPEYVDWMAMETPHVMGGDRVSRGGDPSPFTAQGVVNSMKACLAHLGRPVDFSGLTVAIQGVGSVGQNVGRIMVENGAKVVVADICEASTKMMTEQFGATVVSTEEIFSCNCDIFSPCALGGVISAMNVESLQCAIVCGGANNVLQDPEEDAAALYRRGILYSPDFVANAGGLIELAGLHLGMTREELDDRNAGIEDTTLHVLGMTKDVVSSHQAAVNFATDRIAVAKQENVHAH